MLHMVVMSHGPDTCAASNPASGALFREGFGQMEAVTKKHQVAVQGAWVDPPGHVFYILADAPNAHAVNNMVTDLKLFHWNTVDIHPIVTVEQAAALVAKQ